MKERNYLSFPAVNLNSWMANGVVIKEELMLFLLSLLKNERAVISVEDEETIRNNN